MWKLDKFKVLLALIILLAVVLRFYKLDQVPPSISWDEASVGYNAWAISQTMHDEWGIFLPSYFKSFEDDKHPVHIYLTAIPVAIFGLTDYSVRFMPALMGVLNVLLIYLLVSTLFNNRWIGISSALLMAISPYNLQFSRFNHEANFALFFFMLGVWFFLKSKDQPFLLVFSAISFGIDLITYHSVKVVLPVMLTYLVIAHFRQLKKTREFTLIFLLILLGFMLFIYLNPALSGLARARQTSFSEDQIKNTKLYYLSSNLELGRINLIFNRYLAHFTPNNLILSGDINPKFSIQTVGIMYKIEAILLFCGLIFLLFKHSKERNFILLWLLISPIPASITGGSDEVPHAARSLFLMGSLLTITGFGLYKLISIPNLKFVKLILAIILTAVLVFEFAGYLRNYYSEYPITRAIDWQYGMKPIVEYLKKHPEYTEVYMTDVRSQPYIFFLYYLKFPLPEFLETAQLNTGQYRSSNLVTRFDRYQFGNWDVIESFPRVGNLYIITPSQYDGLRFKSAFKVEEKIYYPGGGEAFYLITTK